MLVDRATLLAGRLDADAYTEPYLVVAIAHRVGPWAGALLVAGAIVLAWKGALLSRWDRLSGGHALRWFVFSLAAALVWFHVTRGHNPFLGQSHAADSLLALALLAALWIRPAFVFPLTVLLGAMLWREVVPALGGSILAHKLQVLHVLTLFCAAMLLHAVTGRRDTNDLVFLTVCLVAGAYATAAFAKLQLGWWSHEHLHLMPASAYGHGWLAGWGAERVGALVELLRPVEPAMRWGVLIIEAGCLLILLRRRLTIAFLVALVGFHLGVTALYGFFFWTWIVVDLALIGLLWSRVDVLTATGHPRTGLVLSIALIASAVLWARPPWLGWFDTGTTYGYRVEALGESGTIYPLHPAYFGPYEAVFTMTAFTYLNPRHRMLTSPYGVVKERARAKAIADVATREELLELESRLGDDRFVEERAARLARFLAVYVGARDRGDGGTVSPWYAPPPQFISHAAGSRAHPPEPVERVRVVEVTTWYDGETPVEVRREQVLSVPIGPAP